MLTGRSFVLGCPVENVAAGLELIMEELPPECRENLDDTLNVDEEEWATWQNCKSWAHAERWLDSVDASYIYDKLGRAPETFNRQPLHVKAAVTYFMFRVLERIQASMN